MNIVNSLESAFKLNEKRNAFCINDTFYTYNEVLSRVLKIRKIIVKKISEEETHIGLVANNDIETYTTIFALWMEGKAYIPINPTAPVARNKEILNLISVKFVFDSSIKTNLPSFNVLNVNDDTDLSTVKLSALNIIKSKTAYVLFTSGSTGKPKGIPISFKNLNTLFTELALDNEYKLNASDRCLQMYDLTFDASLTALLPALLVGACVYTVPANTIKYLSVFKLLDKYKLTVLKMVPSIVYYLRPYFSEINAPWVRYSIFGGEKLFVDVVEEWSKCIPNGTILNHYGPTEFTVCSHYYKFDKNFDKSHNGVVSIGKPFKNIDCLLLDKDGNVIENNVEGELCLSGGQQTSGYWKNNELNKSSFFKHTNKLGELKQFYKTGDLCFRDDDGFYMYVGRKDFQVKIGGYRIELGEIEYHIRKHQSTNLKNSLVLNIKNDNNNDELVLVIESTKFNTTNLIKYLNSKLADYMVPKRVFFINNLPHNKNGKVDRNQLRNLIINNNE
ncbi:AMP-binding protein [Algibacter sp. PT7-4]|uniref:AMP-binding protein n=1 Tax=Algibacter ulvanivorans TaxID=3400999 RepID=UPI003AACBF6C